MITPRALDPALADFRSEVAKLGILSTDDVEPSGALGDARGQEALGLALNARAPGYGAFVCGLEGPRRLEQVAELARRLVQREQPLRDWVYLHRFSAPDRPRALALSAGEGARLKSELRALLRGLQEDLPKAFREEAFDREKAQLVERYEEQQRRDREALRELAERAGFALAFQPTGQVGLIPLIDGAPATSEAQIRALPAQRLAELEEGRKLLEREMREIFERHAAYRHELDAEVRAAERAFAGRRVHAAIDALAARFPSAVLRVHLDELVEFLLDHLDPFRGAAASPEFPFLVQETADPLEVYGVNVVVDNARAERAPVRVVDSPTYKNLFGTIDRSVDRFGRVTTNFSQIHAGALLEADGGVLVIGAEDVLVEPFVWRVLRRALRSGRVEIEAYDPFVGFTPAGLRPEPIEVDTKVVLVGPRWLFEFLLQVDEEFPQLFKVLADFEPVVDRNPDTTRALCGRIAGVVRDEALPHFDARALDALVELAVREAGDRRKLHLGSEAVLDAAREAGTRARAAGRGITERDDVLGALQQRVHRLDRVEQAMREEIARGVVLVSLSGERVGQINALSVIQLGRHAFGRPSRVTAAVGAGTAGLVSIDRETKLSGALHDKGVMILEGFLRRRFARQRPLSLVASVVFEQSYAHVEGDSASLAELLAILSEVGSFRLRQDLAVTGSVNQAGEVQAIAGINEKIEGFYDCCAAAGLTGSQGVVFPAANVENLVLRDDVVDALVQGRFFLYPVASVEEALALFTGRDPGSIGEPGTLFFEVDQSLARMVHDAFAGAESPPHRTPKTSSA
jgi:ATP-dependent Lon protease